MKSSDDGKSPPFRLENWIIFGLILAFSFWLRIYQLSIIPDDFHGDMASYGLQARDLLSGVEQNIFRFGWSNIPMIGYLPAYFSMFIFGNNLFGLNIASVLGGTISIFAVYLLVWRLFDNHRLAAITSLLLAINIPHIHFSRIAAYMDPWPFGFLAIHIIWFGRCSNRSQYTNVFFWKGDPLNYCLLRFILSSHQKKLDPKKLSFNFSLIDRFFACNRSFDYSNFSKCRCIFITQF